MALKLSERLVRPFYAERSPRWSEIFFMFTPTLGKWSNFTSIFFKRVVQPPPSHYEKSGWCTMNHVCFHPNFTNLVINHFLYMETLWKMGDIPQNQLEECQKFFPPESSYRRLREQPLGRLPPPPDATAGGGESGGAAGATGTWRHWSTTLCGGSWSGAKCCR